MSKNANSQQVMAKRLVNAYTPSVQDSRIFKERLTYSTAIASNGAGTINSVISMNPSSSGEWASYAALYDEFRVVGIRVRLVSKQQYSVTAANDSVAIAYDDNNTTALTSLDAGLQYDTSHLLPAVFAHSATGGLNQETCPTFVFMRPKQGGNTPINWIDTSFPVNSLGGVKFYGTNLNISINYYIASVDWYVEFRGRS